MPLHGARELHARLDALGRAPAGIARSWADAAATELRAHTKVRTGATRESIRVESAGDSGAKIVGSKVVTYLSGGTSEHTVEPVRARVLRFSGPGQPTFRPRARVPRMAGTHYRTQAVEDAWEKGSPESALVDAWNGAA